MRSSWTSLTVLALPRQKDHWSSSTTFETMMTSPRSTGGVQAPRNTSKPTIPRTLAKPDESRRDR